jgi:hypothetical protein
MVKKSKIMFRSKDDVELIGDLEAQVRDLKKEITKLKDIKEYEFKKDLDNSTFEFYFEALDAFSIERICDKSTPHTVIGYLRGIDGEGSVTVGEWKFYCSQKEHNRLAQKFVEYVKAQPKKTK